jgi:hypothetical protein
MIKAVAPTDRLSPADAYIGVGFFSVRVERDVIPKESFLIQHGAQFEKDASSMT